MQFDHLTGWAPAQHPELLREAFDLWGEDFIEFRIVGAGEEKPPAVRLFEYTRKLLGKDTPNYAQEIGDCFIPSTQVSMADGSTRAIEDVKVGELVATPFSRSKPVVRTIAKQFEGRLRLTGPEDKRTWSTPDHKFLVGVAGSYDEAEWITAEEQEGDSSEPLSTTVYCIEVDGDHAFFANGRPAHNCVSFGMKNACNYVQALPILNGEFAEYHETYPPYFYGISRVQIGGGKIWGDGSLGTWAAAGVLKYGVLRQDFTGVPAYAGSVAKSWGKSGPPSQFIPEAQKFLVKSAANVTTVDQAMDAIKNGYPVTIASNQGFRMTAGSDGFHAPSGSWGHQMCLIMCDSGGDGIEPHFGILNSWADVHGRIKDFRDPSIEWPVGMLRVRAKVVGSMLAQQDSFAISPFNLFPAQKLPRTAFDPW